MQFFACSGMRFNWGAIFHLARFDTVQSGVSPSKAHRSDFLEKQKRRLLMTSHDSPRILRLGKNKFQRGYLLFSLRFFCHNLEFCQGTPLFLRQLSCWALGGPFRCLKNIGAFLGKLQVSVRKERNCLRRVRFPPG